MSSDGLPTIDYTVSGPLRGITVNGQLRLFIRAINPNFPCHWPKQQNPGVNPLLLFSNCYSSVPTSKLGRFTRFIRRKGMMITREGTIIQMRHCNIKRDRIHPHTRKTKTSLYVGGYVIFLIFNVGMVRPVPVPCSAHDSPPLGWPDIKQAKCGAAFSDVGERQGMSDRGVISRQRFIHCIHYTSGGVVRGR